VVLKREPLGSLREEFLIFGRKFAPGRNWGGKADELHSEIGLDWNVRSTQAQAASSSVFEPVLSVHCFPALHLTAGIEQPIDCLLIQNCQAVQSMGRSMDWSLENNMVSGLIFCSTLTCRRSGHTPFVQTRAEMSDTSAEALEPDPRCQWHNQKFFSWGVNHLMYDLLFLPLISKQLKIGMKHQ